MPKITPGLIRSFDPCYDPVTGLDIDGSRVNDGYLSETYEDTLVGFLSHPEIPVKDKLWLVLGEDFIDAKTLRLFAVWCARESLELVDNPDPRSIEACNVAENFANGEATVEELNAARAAASAAARAAAWAAASAAARAAAWAAEPQAAMAAAGAAAMAAAGAAAMAAAGEDARAARAAQLSHLISMI